MYLSIYLSFIHSFILSFSLICLPIHLCVYIYILCVYCCFMQSCIYTYYMLFCATSMMNSYAYMYTCIRTCTVWALIGTVIENNPLLHSALGFMEACRAKPYTLKQKPTVGLWCALPSSPGPFGHRLGDPQVTQIIPLAV